MLASNSGSFCPQPPKCWNYRCASLCSAPISGFLILHYVNSFFKKLARLHSETLFQKKRKGEREGGRRRKKK
jgi:hypothetical protein